MKKAMENYERILKIAEDDWEYCAIRGEFSSCQQALQELLARLSEKDRFLIAEYIGLYGELDVRLAEIACMYMEFRD